MVCCQSASAQAVWTGAGVGPPNFDGVNWSNAYNWQGNTLPTSSVSTPITFSGAATGVSVNNLGTFTLNGLYFNVPIVLSGGQFNFSSYQFIGTIYPRISQSSSGPVTIGNDLSLGDDIYMLGSGGGTVTLAGAISSNHILYQQSNGITVLSNGGNSFGGTSISTGTVRTDAAGALPTGKFVNVLGGTLDLNGTNQSIGSLGLSAVSGGPATYVQTGSGVLTLGGNVFYSAPSDATFAGILGNLNLGGATRTFDIGTGGYGVTVYASIAGSGGLTKTGVGLLELRSGNSYTGATTVQNGTLSVFTPSSLPTGGAVVIQSGTLALNGYHQSIGALTLSDPSATISSPAPVLQLGGATLQLGGNVTFNPNPGAAPAASITGGTLDLGGATRTFNIGVSAYSYDTVIGAAITGSGGVNKTGGGFLVLTSPNTYSGPTTVNGGILFLGTANALPGVVVVNSGVLSLAPAGTVLGVTAGNYDQSIASLAGSVGSVNLGSAILTTGTDNSNTTFSGALYGSGASLIKVGAGTFTLAAANTGTFYGSITVNGGVLAVNSDLNLGSPTNTLTVNPGGTLRFTANALTGRTFNLNGGTLDLGNGAPLSLSGATVNGGFLRGGGTFGLSNGAALNGVTTFNSTSIFQAGTASVTNFTNGGAFNNAAAQTLSWNGGINQSSGQLTINGIANVSDFTNNGTLNIPAGGTMTNVGSSNLVFGGGSTSFVGSVANPGGKIDLGGQQLVVRGGYLVTNAGSFASGNGVRNGTTVADYGALVKGTGPYQAVLTQNGGQYLPGNSPGTSQVGQFFVNGGGSLIFEITDAGPSASFPSAPGTAGSNPGWGLTQIFSSLEFTATPSNKFNIDMRTQLAPPAAPNSPGQMSSFDPNRAYSWLIFDLQPGAVFNGTFNPNAINFITTQFANATAGGQFALSRNGGQVFLTFTPVPEPAVILGVSFAGLIGWALRRRRRLATGI